MVTLHKTVMGLDMFTRLMHMFYAFTTTSQLAFYSVKVNDLINAGRYDVIRGRLWLSEDITEAEGTKTQASEHLCVSILSPL